jgi:hypothetical protein
MDVSIGATLVSATHSQRSSDRKAECDQLMDELSGLHPILDRDLARIDAIAARLRQLANDQRRDIIPDSSYAAYKISLWRELDLHARRAEDLLNSGGWAEESLDEEHLTLVSQGPRINDYDTALMALSGEPLNASDGPISSWSFPTAQIATVVIGLMIAGVVIVLVVHGRIVPAVVIVIYALRVLHRVGGRIFPSLEDPYSPTPLDTDDRCPGFTSYWGVLGVEIATLNEKVEATTSDTAESSDFHIGISDAVNVRSRLQRIIPPPIAVPLHAIQLKVVDGYIDLFQNVLNGTLKPDEEERFRELVDQANRMAFALETQCFDR